MKNQLRTAATLEVVTFVGVLVAYLTMIAAALRDVNRTLALINVGVRAIEKQAAPLHDQFEDINGNLERAGRLLRETAERSGTA